MNLLRANGPTKSGRSLDGTGIVIRKYTKHLRIIKAKEKFLPGSEFEPVIHDSLPIDTQLEGIPAKIVKDNVDVFTNFIVEDIS